MTIGHTRTHTDTDTHGHGHTHSMALIWRSEVGRLGCNHLYLLSHLTGPGLSFQRNSEVALLSKRMCQLHTERTKSHCRALTLPTLRTFFRGSIQARCLCCWQKSHSQLGSPAPGSHDTRGLNMVCSYSLLRTRPETEQDNTAVSETGRRHLSP